MTLCGINNMKVVLNRSYGGFGLSPEAIKLYAKYANINVYFYEQVKYLRRDQYDEWRKVPDDVELDKSGSYIITLHDLGYSFRNIPADLYPFIDNDIDRTDENLIRVVEELGSKSFGKYAHLEIFDLPNEAFVDTHIESEDGIETIHKNHEYWPKNTFKRRRR